MVPEVWSGGNCSTRPQMIGELRRFYRMDYWGKEELIDRAA